MRPAGYLIDVPITLTVAVRGKELTEERAKEIARNFFLDVLERVADDNNCNGYAVAPGVDITEFSLESSMEDECEVLEELEAEG